MTEPHPARSTSESWEWTIAPDGLIAESRGHYDQAEYDRQLQYGMRAAP